MRYHKKVQGRRWFGGLAYQYYGVMQKVVTMTRVLGRQAEKGETVGQELPDGRYIRSLVVGVRIKRQVLEYKLRVAGTEDMWLPAEGWRVIVPVDVPLRILHQDDRDVRWRGKWELMESTVQYPVDPYREGVRRVWHPDGSFFTVVVS